MKLLILSYHFPPFNVVASYRTKAYADYFPKYGIDTTVITHPWQENESEIIEEERNGSKIIRIPRKKTFRFTLFKFFNRVPVLRIIINYLVIWMGYLDGANVHTDFYFTYKKFLQNHLKQKKYDLVLAVFSPYQHIRLARFVKKKNHIPFIVDFRDLYDNSILDNKYKPSINQRILNSARKFHLRKWVSDTNLVISTSQVWADHIGQLGNKRGIEVLNGYEQEFFENYSKVASDKFEISSIGTLHKSQQWMTYLEAIEDFVLTNKLNSIKVNFIGVNMASQKMLSKWAGQLKPSLIELEIRARVDKKTVIEFFKTSSVLLLPALVGNVGMYSAKLTEYIASKTPIVYFPSENGVIPELIRKTKAGYVLGDHKEIVNLLTTLHKEWLKSGIVESHLDQEIVHTLSREYQVKQLAKHIKQAQKENVE